MERRVDGGCLRVWGGGKFLAAPGLRAKLQQSLPSQPSAALTTWPFTKSPDALHLGVLYYTYLGTNASGDFSNCQVDNSGTSHYDPFVCPEFHSFLALISNH